MVKRKTTAQFIQDARKVHGDKYDYSLTEYVSRHRKIEIVCPVHGIFSQTPGNHLIGRGCAKCAGKFKTTVQFIQEVRKVHGDKYDYSLVEYVAAKTKVKIICPCHGIFEQSPDSHKKYGCSACAGNVQKTTEKFIAESMAVHGETYDYSLTKYLNAKTKVKIICPVHGIFEQSPDSHLRHGCLECGINSTASAKRKTTKSFIQSANLIHGEKYNYSLVEYANANTKVKIICPVHGVFSQAPSSHLSGSGCPGCARNEKKTTDQFIQDSQKKHGNKYDYSLTEYVRGQSKIKVICPVHGLFSPFACHHVRGVGCPSCAGKDRKTVSQFIEDAIGIHGDKYDYSLVEYANANTKVEIICPVHGVFSQAPSSHLSGSGCPSCAEIVRREKQTKTVEQFIYESTVVHGKRYDYSFSEYVNSWMKIKIVCPEHGEFWQAPSSHLSGRGCPNCADYGFNSDKPGLLYFLKFQKDFAGFWKIGITNRTVEERFRKDALFITDRHEWQFDKGIDAYEIEQQVLKQFQDYRQPPMLFPLLDYGGDSECFTPNLPHKKVIEVINKLASTCV